MKVECVCNGELMEKGSCELWKFPQYGTSMFILHLDSKNCFVCSDGIRSKNLKIIAGRGIERAFRSSMGTFYKWEKK